MPTDIVMPQMDGIELARRASELDLAARVRQLEDRLAAGADWRDANLVFTTRKGYRWSPEMSSGRSSAR